MKYNYIESILIVKGGILMLKEELKKEQPRRLEKNVEPKSVRKEEHPKHSEREVKPKLIKKEEHPKHHKHIPAEVERHLLSSQEELEIMINLCGNKKELIDVLNHINHLIVDTPREIKSEVKVKKLK